MTEEAKEAKRAYNREWRRNHPEAVRRYNETYWEKKANQRKEKEDGNNDKKQGHRHE